MSDCLQLTTFAVTTSHWMDVSGLERAELVGGPTGEWVHYVWHGGMWVASGKRTPNQDLRWPVVVRPALGQFGTDRGPADA